MTNPCPHARSAAESAAIEAAERQHPDASDILIGNYQ